ncbi:serine protease [Janthinobacterium sp. BJB412]|nr:serine protease [Janthinobacterium sp. BJB412]
MRNRLIALLLFWPAHHPAAGADLQHAIEAAKRSVVGIGSFQKLRSPAINFVGTGFVVGDGLSVITAAHVLQDLQNAEQNETLGVLIPMGESSQFRAASVVAVDREHDLAQLRIPGAPLPAMQLGDSADVAEGRSLAFTGFPLGMLLGLHHVTHRAMVSSITPVAMPSASSRKLDVKLVGQLQRVPYAVFQLDGTAYPGNSGSPLYDPDSGQVYGVINMVYVKGLKEAAIATPSGITYAIPSNFIRELLRPR